MKLDFQSQVLDPELWNALKAKYKKSSAATDSCRYDVFCKRDHDDHPRLQEALYPRNLLRNLTHQHLNNCNNKILMLGLIKMRMEVTIKDMMSNQFRDVEEYAYHLEQANNYIENQIVWESRQEDLKHRKPEALVFYGPQRNLNEPLRYLYNKDLFSLKNGNTKEKTYMLSLHKIHATSFPKEDLEEMMI
ncbi:hypothetical protein Tco_0715426 [Tanacetum coccineum]